MGFRVVLISLILWHGIEGIASVPNSLSYFNEMAHGQGYRYLRDSNIDWGQDLKEVAVYARHQAYHEIAVNSLSRASLDYYGVKTVAWQENDCITPRNIVYAIGVHNIDGIQWAVNRKPDKIIGGSMFIYDMRGKSD